MGLLGNSDAASKGIPGAMDYSTDGDVRSLHSAYTVEPNFVRRITMKRMTITQFLEKHYDANLQEDLERFLQIDPRRANELWDAMYEYLAEGQNDFYVPERNLRFSRPFLWPEVQPKIASQSGANAFMPLEERYSNEGQNRTVDQGPLKTPPGKRSLGGLCGMWKG
jgi:hypothetical protein